MSGHTISDLTSYARNTSGDIPPALVGASTTVAGGKMYLFGGRLGTLRRMSSDIWSFDLTTSVWNKIIPHSPDDLTPLPRNFHSADVWNDCLVIFGGMGYASHDTEDLCVLADIRFFSFTQQRWLPPDTTQTQARPIPSPLPSVPNDSDEHSLIPRARYAHLSAISSSRLFIIGGQDMSNVWLDDIHVYDMEKHAWIERREYPRHCGTYRSVAVAGQFVTRDPVRAGVPTRRQESVYASLKRPSPNPEMSIIHPNSPTVASDELVLMPYSSEPTPDHPNEIHLYSNYNFTNVQRELELMIPTGDSFAIEDRSATMSGPAFPPGLRFPTGAILGHHLIISGVYLAQSYQSFSIWALDLVSMTWSRIDSGSPLTSGSWSRGVLWGEGNKFVVFGNRDGNLVEDYNRRLLSWENVAYVELEAFGIYQPPPLLMPFDGQQMGLDALDAEVFADFEIVCDDGRRLKCSRKLLEERWPWFRTERIKYVRVAKQIIDSQTHAEELETPLPERPSDQIIPPEEDRPDPRLTPRLLRLSEPYPITKALLQYLYTLNLSTTLQHAPLVLNGLLILSSIYEIPHLAALVRHAIHRTLSPGTSLAVYDVTSLCDCQNLQIRALRIVMATNRRYARNRERSDRRPPTRDDNGDGGPDQYQNRARARGMSDAPSHLGTSHSGRGFPSSSSIGGGLNGHSQMQSAYQLAVTPATTFKPASPIGSVPEEPHPHSESGDGLIPPDSDSAVRGRTSPTTTRTLHRNVSASSSTSSPQRRLHQISEDSAPEGLPEDANTPLIPHARKASLNLNLEHAMARRPSTASITPRPRQTDFHLPLGSSRSFTPTGIPLPPSVPATPAELYSESKSDSYFGRSTSSASLTTAPSSFPLSLSQHPDSQPSIPSDAARRLHRNRSDLSMGPPSSFNAPDTTVQARTVGTRTRSASDASTTRRQPSSYTFDQQLRGVSSSLSNHRPSTAESVTTSSGEDTTLETPIDAVLIKQPSSLVRQGSFQVVDLQQRPYYPRAPSPSEDVMDGYQSYESDDGGNGIYISPAQSNDPAPPLQDSLSLLLPSQTPKTKKPAWRRRLLPTNSNNSGSDAPSKSRLLLSKSKSSNAVAGGAVENVAVMQKLHQMGITDGV